jgi:hypothetical protein
MTIFILFDNHIIVSLNDIVIEIINIITGISRKSIGSEKNKYKKMYEFPKSKKLSNLIFNDWNELCKHYNINNFNISGMYTSYYKNKQVKIKFYHINFCKEGLYEEFYENGKIKIKCNYISDKLYDEYTEYSYNSSRLCANYYIMTTYKDDKIDGIYHKNNMYGCEYYTYTDGEKNGKFFINYIDLWNKNMYAAGFTKYNLAGEYCYDVLHYVNIYIKIYSELILVQKIYFDKLIYYTLEMYNDDESNSKIKKYIIEDDIYDYINNFRGLKTF